MVQAIGRILLAWLAWQAVLIAAIVELPRRLTPARRPKERKTSSCAVNTTRPRREWDEWNREGAMARRQTRRNREKHCAKGANMPEARV